MGAVLNERPDPTSARIRACAKRSTLQGGHLIYQRLKLIHQRYSTKVKSQSTRRPRNPVAKAVRAPLYKMRVVKSKRRKLLEKWTEAVGRGTKDVKGGADER